MGADVQMTAATESTRKTARIRKKKHTGPADVRADFVPAEHYISPEFLRLEKERMWPRVWQVACREEEVAHVGAYVTYDIMDESIVVARVSEHEIKAYYNVCQHRGRRLVDGCGQMNRFHCRFHGWQWNLDGSLVRVLDREDWAGCPNFRDADLRLADVRVDTWAGFVFVNMNPDAEPLSDYLGQVQHYLDPFEIGKMRYRWYVSVRTPCNWKVGLGAFDEGYHVAQTHPQLLIGHGEDITRCRTFGRHGMFYIAPNPTRPMGSPSPRTGLPVPEDLRPHIIEYHDLVNYTLRAMFTERDSGAARRLMELDPATPAPVLMAKMVEFQREAAITAGVGWPDVSMQQMVEAGNDWHIFPNLIILPRPDAALCYRILPDARDPDRCFLEIYSLQRYAPGAEPKLERQYLHGEEDWRNVSPISSILQQDFNNIGEVQRGMKSRGFKGARTN
ncbi:MAG: aromatic ring-hydroxylating dioxygenase subunit alpha, partial [Rhodospirillaceae bacterium]